MPGECPTGHVVRENDIWYNSGMEKGGKIRLLIADDHSVVRAGLAAVFSFEDDLEVVGEAADGREAVRRAAECNPSVVVMDLMMPRMDGIEATRLIREANPGVHVMVLTSCASADEIRRVIDAGAEGVLVKTVSNEKIADAIRRVAAGQQEISPEFSKLLRQESPAPELTAKQREILASVTRGLSNDDIALQLGVSINAVKHQLTAIFAKLGAATRAEAVGIAMRKALLKI